MHGSWRIAGTEEPAARKHGEHAYYFSPHGELILSVQKPAGVQRAMLTWERRDDRLIIDQPSAPAEESVAWLLASEHTLQLDGSWYLRESAAPLDAEAPWWALVAGAGWYGIENAAPEPFTPFLMLDVESKRMLRRLVTQTAVDAERGADQVARGATYERGAWVRDGRITRDDAAGRPYKCDAILVTRFEPGGVRGVTHALPYALDGERGRIDGGFVTLP